MAKYTDEALREMAREAMRAYRSLNPADISRVMMFTLIMQQRTSLEPDEIWTRIEALSH